MTRKIGLIWGAGSLVALALGATAWRLTRESPRPMTAGPDPAVAAGKALFDGSVPLKARMVGHETDLPPSAVRCANCHTRQGPPPAAASARGLAALPGASPRDIYAAALSRAALLQDRPRRGGPPSRYDQAAFCRVLRDGIDPASVIVTQTMPRYSVSEQECHDLWTFATAE